MPERDIMNRTLIYHTIKMTMAVIVAIVLASVLHLHYAMTAGVITMLSLLNNRKQTYTIGFKRIVASSFAIILGTVVFTMGAHTIWSLGLFLLVYTFLLSLVRFNEGLAVGTVLVTHLYSLQIITVQMVTNEIILMLVGIAVAWLFTLHMPNLLGDIKSCMLEADKEIKDVLAKMSLLIVNQCSIDEPRNHLYHLDDALNRGLPLAIAYNDNFLTRDNSYYIYYFQMRRQQYLLLSHMENHFRQLFIALDHARPLSEFTARIADELHEENTAIDLLAQATELLAFYRASPLPMTREEFENRAILYQYLSDVIQFIEIKIRFLQRYKSR